MDDTISSFRRRLELFRELTLPMLKTLDNEGRLTIVSVNRKYKQTLTAPYTYRLDYLFNFISLLSTRSQIIVYQCRTICRFIINVNYPIIMWMYIAIIGYNSMHIYKRHLKINKIIWHIHIISDGLLLACFSFKLQTQSLKLFINIYIR